MALCGCEGDGGEAGESERGEGGGEGARGKVSVILKMYLTVGK